MAEFTTGEAVALQLPVARIPSRAAAFLIDVVVQLLLGWLLAFGVLVLFSSADRAWVATASVLMVVTVLVGYPVTCETLLRGSTPGKLVFGLRVVRADGGPVDFRHTITRGLAGAIVDFWMLGGFGVIAVITSMCSPHARRVGDVLAGTVVVYIREQLPPPALAVPPHWLTGWSAKLDLAALPDDLALSMRHYLTRVHSLTPAAQHELGVALVSAVCARLRVAPPEGYPPVQILGSVIAERQRRALPPPVPSTMPVPGVLPPGVVMPTRPVGFVS
ncbi:RDD family protein [Nocardia paucivorans]|uniref:RDD family protein n=1 Tax=Nocardia paucivorans TaxID=114259 RepID=UPI00031F8BDA|nr:RDD family protein [Nocardia paucivorans]